MYNLKINLVYLDLESAITYMSLLPTKINGLELYVLSIQNTSFVHQGAISAKGVCNPKYTK